MGRPPKVRRLTETSSKAEWSTEDDSSDTNRKRKLSHQDNMTESEFGDKLKMSDDLNNRFKSLISSEYPCPSQQVLAKHSKILNDLISTNSQDARMWSQDEVAEFVNSLPSCKEHSGLFITHSIDGEAFLMLTQKDLVDILNFKLGPAIKLYNSIVLLRQNVNFYN